MSEPNLDRTEFARQQGISEEEWKLILQRLGRLPTDQEVSVIAALWSEAVSGKSSASLVNQLFNRSAAKLLIPGSNAACLRLPNSEILVFEVVQHNDQLKISAREATRGLIGKACASLAAAGAEPLALYPFARLGPPEQAGPQKMFAEIVDELGRGGNIAGVPVAGVDLRFHERYGDGALLNCLVLGQTTDEKLPLQPKGSPGALVVYFGAETSLAGLPEAGTTAEGSALPTKRKLIVSDPLIAAKLVNAAVEAANLGLLEDLIAVDAAGLGAAIFALANRLGYALNIELGRVPTISDSIGAMEILLSETSERLLASASKENYSKLKAVFEKWGLSSTVIGEVTGADTIKIVWNRHYIVDLPLFFARDSAIKRNFQLVKYPPMLKKQSAPREQIKFRDRQSRKHANLTKELLQSSSEQKGRTSEPVLLEEPESLSDAWIDLLAAPNVCSLKQVSQGFDQRMRSTVWLSAPDAAVIRLKPFESSSGIVVSFSSRGLYVGHEPYLGTVQSVAQVMRNVSAMGGEPMAIATGLNFGDPARYRELCDLAESLRALNDCCEIWDLPILSNAVSLSNGSEAAPILPTPAIALVGYVSDIRLCVSPQFKGNADEMLLVGVTLGEIRCTEYSLYCHRSATAEVPEINFALEQKTSDFVRLLIENSLLQSAAAIGPGGLAVALTSSAVSREPPIGAKLELDSTLSPDEYRADTMLFSETSGRFLVTCKPEVSERIRQLSYKVGVPVTGAGKVGGRSLIVTGAASSEIALSTAVRVWARSLDYLFV